MLAVLPLAVLALGMPAAAGAFSWNLPATTISPESEDSGEARVAVAPDGTTTVIWLKSSNATVYAATRPAGQAVFGPPELLSDPIGTDQWPRVAVSPDGTTTVVWKNTGADVIQAVTRPPGSATFGPIEVISEVGLQPFLPEVVAGGDGSVTAIWEARDFIPDPPYATYSQVKAAVRLPGQSAFGPAKNISEQGALSNACPTLQQVASAPEGTTTAVWSLVDVSGDCVIQSATRAAGQASFPSPSTTPPDVLSAPGEEGNFPQVAVGRNRKATAVWRNATHGRIDSATRTAGAASFGDPVDISDGENGVDPQVALAPDGQATAVWSTNSTDLIEGATRAAGSSAWGEVTTVSILDGPSTAQYFPKLAVANDGRATVVWTNLVSPGGNRLGTLSTTRAPGSSDWSAAEMLGPDGGPFSYPFPIPDLAVGADGRATAVWNANRDGRLVIQAVSSTIPDSVTVTSLKSKVTRNSVLITSKAKVSGKGKITQRATTGKGSGMKTWCRTSSNAGKAGTYSLSCNLGKKGRAALRKAALKLTVRTTFTPAAGTAVTVDRNLTVPRKR